MCVCKCILVVLRQIFMGDLKQHTRQTTQVDLQGDYTKSINQTDQVARGLYMEQARAKGLPTSLDNSQDRGLHAGAFAVSHF